MLEIYFMITLSIIMILLYDFFMYSKDSYKEERNEIRKMRRKYLASIKFKSKNLYNSSGLISSVSYNKGKSKYIKNHLSDDKSETLTRFFDVG